MRDVIEPIYLGYVLLLLGGLVKPAYSPVDGVLGFNEVLRKIFEKASYVYLPRA